jgi:polyphenol oxidase
VRNPRHVPPAIVDLQFVRKDGENNFTDEQQIQQNLRTMYKQVRIRGAVAIHI